MLTSSSFKCGLALRCLIRTHGWRSRASAVLRRTTASSTVETEPLRRSTFEMENELKNLIAAQKEKSKGLDAATLERMQPSRQSDFPAKTMNDSYLETYICLSSDARTREKYLTAHNLIRFGRLLEDLDIFAVASTYAHCSTDETVSGRQMDTLRANVTASVERIDVRPEYRCVDNTKDIRVNGNVVWVGRSSMAVNIQVSQDLNGWKPLLDAMFIIVSRHPVLGKPCLVPPLVASSDREHRLLAIGDATHVQRMQAKEESLLRKPPTPEERLVIHDLFLSTLDASATTIKVRCLPDNALWMEDTLLKKITVCFPEFRNLYGKIFGGFLMREAYELGWSTACLHARASCLPLAVDDIRFEVPVEVGSFLFMSSQIVYTKEDRMQVKVHAEVVDVKTGVHRTTNIFHFTFVAVNGISVRTVFPKSYAESMMYLAGVRHFKYASLHAVHEEGSAVGSLPIPS